MTPSGDEIFDLVDECGRSVGRARRAECHANPSLIHPSVHVFVFDCAGRLLLQQRSMNKDVQPGRWDTSVGGHLHPGEDPLEGAEREMREEIGVVGIPLLFSHQYLWRSARETEFVRSYVACSDGPFAFDPGEIAAGRFWTAAEVMDQVGKGVFTPNFEHELGWLARDPAGALKKAGVDWTMA